MAATCFCSALTGDALFSGLSLTDFFSTFTGDYLAGCFLAGVFDLMVLSALASVLLLTLGRSSETDFFGDLVVGLASLTGLLEGV